MAASKKKGRSQSIVVRGQRRFNQHLLQDYFTAQGDTPQLPKIVPIMLECDTSELAAALGVTEATADHFTNAGGLLLQRGSVDAAWELKHVVDQTNWWVEAPSPP